MSFSVIAVVILLATAASGAYFADKELEKARELKETKILSELDDALDDLELEITLCAAAKSYDLVSSWHEYPVNETELSSRYSRMMQSYLDTSFPREQSGITVTASNWSGALFFAEKSTLDIVPSEETEETVLEIDGSEMEYEQIASAATDELAVTTANPFYLALGRLTLVVESHDIVLAKDLSFEKPIISILPFLESKLRTFQSSSEGEFADLGELVAYMLTTLAQLRVLEGYGIPQYSGLGTASILTEEDAYRATAVALLIEQVRLFRDFDQAFASDVLQVCSGGDLGMKAIANPLHEYLDPAELFLWFLGRTEPSIDPRFLVAQAMSGMADQLAVKLLDYTGWLGTMDLAAEVMEAISATLDSLIDRLTGDDSRQESVVRWILRNLEMTSSDPSLYTEFFASESDFSVQIPERTFYVENAAGELFPVWLGGESVIVNVPSSDVLACGIWPEFYSAFKDGQNSMTQLVYDSLARLSMDIASACTVETSATAIDPFDQVDLFTTMAERTGSVEILLDAEGMGATGSNLPMFAAQWELAQEFTFFVEQHEHELIPWDSVDGMYDDICGSVLATARYSYIPDLCIPIEQQLEDLVKHELRYSLDWGVGLAASSSFEGRSYAAIKTLSAAVNSSLSRSDDRFFGPFVDSVGDALLWGTGTVPGVCEVVENALTLSARAVLAQRHIASHKRSAYVDLGGEFQFWDGDLQSAQDNGTALTASVEVSIPGGLPPLQIVPFDPESGYGSIDELFPVDEVLVQVRQPWQYERGESSYPNLHLTSLTNISPTPYSSQWLVSVRSVLMLSACSTDDSLNSLLTPGANATAPITISFSVPIVVHSAWPLVDVEYNPTNTILSDAIRVAKEFCDILWEKLEPIVGWLKGGLESILRFVGDVFTTMTSFTTKVVKVIAKVSQVVIETLQTYIQKFADSVLGKAVKLFVDLVGNVEIRISMYGFTLIIQTNLPDLLYRKSQDLVRIIVCTDRFGPGISFGLRIARLTDGRYDIVVNGTLTMKSGSVEVVIDPLMIILRRFIEVHCRTDTWALDMVMPEAEPYETAQVTTADMPGAGLLLSNIPIPLLGVSASVEAGLRLKYSPPFPLDIVVNEFEANPAGDDSGREWVELYNPLEEARCVDGWTLSTMHGESNELVLSGVVPAHGLMTVYFPQTAIDNGIPGDPFNDGDSLVLRDPSGRTIDVTPTLSDSANDARTNQRTWDGGPRWALRDGTKDDSNGPALVMATSDFIVKALFQAFKDAFDETMLTEVTASLDFVVLLSKRVLNHFIENLLSMVKDIIHEVTLFVKVVFSDAAGVAGMGIRASFAVTGESIVELLRWLIHSLATFIVNLGRGGNPLAYPSFPEKFFSGLFLRLDFLFEVGTPKMIRTLGVTPNLENRLTCVATIGPNIPCLGKLAGRDWGQWCVEFGVYLEDVPREYVSGFLLKDTGNSVDLWLMKGRVYGL